MMPPPPLDLPSETLAQIVAHGTDLYPLEACGVLIGTDTPSCRKVVMSYEVNNTWHMPDEQNKRFMLDSTQQLQIERWLEGTNLQVVGFYHTHPDDPAEPSAFDLEAAWGFYSYLIVSITRDQMTEARCWLLDESNNTFIEQAIHYAGSDDAKTPRKHQDD